MYRNWTLVLLTVLLLSACSAPMIGQSCSDQSQQFTTESSLLLDEWQDAMDLASSTPRANLAEVVGDLQEIRRRTSALAVPDCASSIKTSLVNSMDASIDGFLGFLAQDSDSAITADFERATAYMTETVVRMERLTAGEDVNAPLPTPRPTRTPLPTNTRAPTRTPAPAPTTVVVTIGFEGVNQESVQIPTRLRVYSGDALFATVYDGPNGAPLDYCELPGSALVEAVELDDLSNFVRVERTNCNGWVRAENLMLP